MQIQQVLTGLADAARTGTRKYLGAAETAGEKSAEIARSSPLSPSRLMADIVAHYDVTDITPAEFSEMIHQFAEAGVLPKAELDTLAAIRVELEAEGIEADESVNLIEFYTERLDRVRRDLELEPNSLVLKRQLADVLQKLQWLQKLDLIHSDPDVLGLDALA